MPLGILSSLRAFCAMKPDVEFYSSYVVNCVINAFLSPTATMLNVITIHAIRKTSSLPKPLKTLLLSLAVSDLGVGLFVQPLSIALLSMKLERNMIENNQVYAVAQIAYRISTNLFSIASFLGVTALSVDRFLAIYLHLRYQELVTYQRVVVLVISLWVFSAVLSLVRLWTPVSTIFTIFAIIAVLCLIIAAVANYKIFMAVRRHAHQIQVQVQEVVIVVRLRKSAAATGYVFLVYVVCYLPNTLILCIIAVSSRPINALIHTYTLTFVFLNSSLNPLIYCWKMRHIRHAVMNILRNLFTRN